MFQTAQILSFFNDIWRQIVAYCLLVASGASFAARCAIAIWSKDRKTIAKLIQCSGSQIPDLFCYRHFYLFSKIISYSIQCQSGFPPNSRVSWVVKNLLWPDHTSYTLCKSRALFAVFSLFIYVKNVSKEPAILSYDLS